MDWMDILRDYLPLFPLLLAGLLFVGVYMACMAEERRSKHEEEGWK